MSHQSYNLNQCSTIPMNNFIIVPAIAHFLRQDVKFMFIQNIPMYT